MDGRENRHGCDSDEEACRVCIRRPNRSPSMSSIQETPPPSSTISPRSPTDDAVFQQRRIDQEEDYHRRRRAIQQEAREVNGLRQYLDRFQGQCPYCRRMDIDEVYHSIYHCRQPGVQPIRDQYIIWKAVLHDKDQQPMERFSGCWECFTPQDWCCWWVEKRMGKGEGNQRVPCQKTPICQYREMVLGEYCVRKHMNIEYRDGLKRRIEPKGFDADDEADCARYLGRQVKWGGLEVNRLIWEVWRFIEPAMQIDPYQI